MALATRMHFADRIHIMAATEDPARCWNWPGQIIDGYGMVETSLDERGSRRWRAHCAAWLVLVGPVADGLQIDHLCRNRACVNPAHMEPVTPRVNTLRSMAPSAINARRTHCKQGHEFTRENTRIVPTAHGVGRTCRECERIHARQKYVRQTPLGPRSQCKRGHLQISANVATVFVGGQPKRRCRVCHAMREAVRARAVKASQLLLE
jgi:hypothetical protein